jgi:hypothetical protein
LYGASELLMQRNGSKKKTSKEIEGEKRKKATIIFL